MPALFFPDANALRLALASGLIPAAIGRAPASAGFDAHGRMWLVTTAPLPREALAALARLGVQALGGAGVATTHFACWAELVPLQPADEPHAGAVRFLVPEKQLAGFTARLPAAIRHQAAVRLTESALASVTVVRPPPALLAACAEPDSQVEAFAEQTPSVWALCGWRHPVAGLLVIPDGSVLFLRPPRSVTAVPLESHPHEPDEYRLRSAAVARPAEPPAPPRIGVRLTLAADPHPTRDSLWVLDPAGETAFWDYCGAADENLTRRLEAAPVGNGVGTRLVVRAIGKRAAFLPFPATGYAHDPRVPGLYVPSGKTIRPTLRVRQLARILGVEPGRVVWVEPCADGLVPHAVPEAAFRPVSELVEYGAPRTSPLRVVPRNDPFALERFVAQDDLAPVAEAEIDLSDVPDEVEPEVAAEAPEQESGWFVRSLRRLMSRLRPVREGPPEPVPPRPETAPRPEAKPGQRRIASTDALLHGHDRAVRRRELELRLFRDLPRLGPTGAQTRWADLAAVYSTSGNALDAALCWLNASWESPTPPADWLEQWFLAECRAARLAPEAEGLERWLSEPGRPGVGRVIAAFVAAAGFAPGPIPEFTRLLPRLLAVLDQNFDDIPVRGVWLARLAAAHVSDGDALGLARWRDRVLARLADRGPGLDLDEPSFLRFHGTASAERFQTAREWLVRLREPVLSWVQRHGGGNLRWAGLDPEAECTAAYAQFMLAWGLACLGERTRSKDWAARARKAVGRAGGPGADPAAHAVLGDLFLLRVRDAQEGRAAKPGVPPDLQARIVALPERAGYAVHRLREHSRILEPLDRVRAFRGIDLKVFRGADRLGERLSVLAGSADRAQVVAEADELLKLCDERPTTDTLPRVVLTLLDLATWLERPAYLRLLDLLPTAIDWMEPLLLAQPWRDDERPRKFVDYSARMLGAAFGAVVAHPAAEVTAPVSALVRRLIGLGNAVRAPLLRTAADAFRALRRLGLRGEIESLLRLVDPGPQAPTADRLGLVCGWYAAGDEEAAAGTLDAARDELFLPPGGDARSRTVLALAYADALGFAPAPIAPGRLEEIFQRLAPVEVLGSTNSWFTLRPLQLVDTVVRAVVTDEFALGPAVRGWLDDDEFLIRGRVHRDLAAVLREQGLA